MPLADKLRPLLGDILVIDGAKLLALNVAGACLAFVSHILFARWLTVDSYGIYVFALSWLNILVIFIQAGMNLSMIRFVAEYRAVNNRAAMRAVLRFSNLVVLALGLGILILGALAVHLAMAMDAGEMRKTLYVMLVLTIAMALVQQRSAMLQGLERAVPATVLFEIVRPAFLLVVLFAVIQSAAADASTVITLNLAVSIGVLAVFEIYVRTCLNAEPVAPEQKQTVPPASHWLRISLPYVAVTALTIVLSQMDILMIGYLLGPEQAGIYAPAAKVALLAIFPAIAIRTRFGPMAAKLFAQGRTVDLQGRLNAATLVSAASCLAVCFIIILARHPILGLFGTEYVAGEWAAVVLAAGYLVYSVLGAAEMFFLVGPFERANAWVAGATLGLNFVLNLILIPRFGIEGAAIATAASIIFRALAAATIVRGRTGLSPWAVGGTKGATP